ncbi:hypothetical protein EJB05_01263, partial [Eragrostis curvula]
MANYKQWTSHGEADRVRHEVIRPRIDETFDEDAGVADMLNDYAEAHNFEEGCREEEPEPSAKAYYDMLDAAQRPLHGHTNVYQLDAIARLMAVKSQFSMSHRNFDVMLTVIASMLPEGHNLPKNMYESQKLLRALKMPYEEIHACPKGCVLFRKEHAEALYCPKCSSSRYLEVESGDGEKRQTPVAAKILRYLPFIPRIQRLYMTEETAKQMTWHKKGVRYHPENRVHPADGESWTHFDRIHHKKADEARNVRVALATDGFNPYGMGDAPYTCWPVSWTRPREGSHKRKVNGILGVLCRQHYPGLVQLPEGLEVADTFDHYAAVNDVEDREGTKFNNLMDRVINEMLDFYRIEEGYEDLARQVARTACHKLVKDMMYEARNQAIIDLNTAMDVQVKRKEAVKIFPTKEQYLAVIPWWMAAHNDCWDVLVDKWCAEDWAVRHEACRQRRLLMQGPSHHQGSLSLNEYAAKYSDAHGGQPINTFEAFALSHKGKASAPIHYNPEDPPEAYSNPTAYSRLSLYSEVAKEVYGQDYDPRSHDLDGEVVMRAGKGKKHGLYYLGDSVIDTASTPTLSQILARTVSGGPSIRERPTATQALQAQLEEERARREQLEATLEQRVQAQVQAQMQAQVQDMFSYFQAQFEAIGHPCRHIRHGLLVLLFLLRRCLGQRVRILRLGLRLCKTWIYRR